MAGTTELKSFDNRGYITDESPPDKNANNFKQYEADAGQSNNNGNSSTRDGRIANMTAEEIRIEKRSIMKNVILISFAFLLLFTAFQSMSALQSSINKVGITQLKYHLWIGLHVKTI